MKVIEGCHNEEYGGMKFLECLNWIKFPLLPFPSSSLIHDAFISLKMREDTFLIYLSQAF